VARGTGGSGAFHIEINDVDVTGTIPVGNTGGWQNWTNKTVLNVALDSGEQVVKIVIEAGEININRLEFVLDQVYSPPVFAADPIHKPDADEDSVYSDTLAGSVTNTNPGDTLEYAKLSGPGWLNVAADGALSGTPGNDDVGPNSWTVQVADGRGGTDTAALNITVVNVNDAPYFWVAEPIQSFPGTEDRSYSGSLAGSAKDDDVGDSLTYSRVSGPDWLDVAGNGVLSGTPHNDDVGLNQWTVMVSDGNGGTDTAVLEVMVANVNDAPVFTVDPISSKNAEEDRAYSDTLTGLADDVDAGDALTYSKVSGPAWLNVAADGALSGTPGAGDAGANMFTVKVEDPSLASDTATLNITVDSTLPPPVLNIEVSGSNIEVFWPASPAGFSLYGATSLEPPVVWSSVTNIPVSQGDQWTVSIPNDEAPRFFRLVAP
jgi:hypothetical protein